MPILWHLNWVAWCKAFTTWMLVMYGRILFLPQLWSWVYCLLTLFWKLLHCQHPNNFICKNFFSFKILVLTFTFSRNAVYVSPHMRMVQSSILFPATIIFILRVLWNGWRWMQHVHCASLTFSREVNRYEEKTGTPFCLGSWIHNLLVCLYRKLRQK